MMVDATEKKCRGKHAIWTGAAVLAMLPFIITSVVYILTRASAEEVRQVDLRVQAVERALIESQTDRRAIRESLSRIEASNTEDRKAMRETLQRIERLVDKRQPSPN